MSPAAKAPTRHPTGGLGTSTWQCSARLAGALPAGRAAPIGRPRHPRRAGLPAGQRMGPRSAAGDWRRRGPRRQRPPSTVGSRGRIRPSSGSGCCPIRQQFTSLRRPTAGGHPTPSSPRQEPRSDPIDDSSRNGRRRRNGLIPAKPRIAAGSRRSHQSPLKTPTRAPTPRRADDQ